MDKQKVIFIVIAAAIIGAALLIPNLLFPPKPAQITTNNPTSSNAGNQTEQPQNNTISPATSSASGNQVLNGAQLLDPSRPADAFIACNPDGSLPLIVPENIDKPVEFKNDLYKASFNPKGASLIGLELLKHLDGKAPVQMLFNGENSGLITRFGNTKGQLMLEPFQVRSNSKAKGIEFFANYQRNDQAGKILTVIKRYNFIEAEYLFELEIELKYSDSTVYIPKSTDGFVYTLSLGPQIGPLSSQVVTNGEIRRLVYYTGSKKETPASGPNTSLKIQDKISWAAIDGKYFSFIVIPPLAEQEISYVGTSISQSMPGSELNFARKEIQSPAQTDKFRFYVGPKISARPQPLNPRSVDNPPSLADYDVANDNSTGMYAMKFQEVIDFDLFGWLAIPLKWIMQAFYFVIPNWGIAIILLTILVKVALFPLSKKSAEGMARMAELNPKIAALKEKHASDPQKLNQEMAALYQKEKISPLSGCLPMLLQMPFFFAMYSMFNQHFDLRGAMFIPGWIPDLSVGESIFHFAGFTIPLVGHISDIRLLPFIYLATQIFSTKFTPQNASGQSNAQMKIMMYALPAIFLFILYNAPSGLLVYWIFQNVLTVIQQIIVNRMMKNRKPVDKKPLIKPVRKT